MRNISLKTYAVMKDTSKYDVILEHLNPCASFMGKSLDIMSMPYTNVKHCIRLLNRIKDWEGIIELFHVCFDIDTETFWKSGVKEYYAARKAVIKGFETVVSNEVKLLASTSTDAAMWQMAGAESLNQFSDTLPLVQLGEKFGMYPFEIGRKPYSEVLSLLVQIKRQGEVETEYKKLTSKK